MSGSNNSSLWPCFVPPEKDELFSSWIMRLSCRHMLKSHTFSKIFFEDAALWNRDIDIRPIPIITEKILYHTLLNLHQVNSMFLKDYEGKLFPSFNLNDKIINDIGVVHRVRKHYGLMYCPGCLDQNIQYYRKSWRLKTSLACSNCNLMLRNSCPTCLRPICFHRLENGKKNNYLKQRLSICYFCSTDLRKGNVYEMVNPEVLEYQKYIDDTIRLGYNLHTGYSFQYLSALVNFQRNIVTSSKLWNRIKEAILKEFGVVFNIDPHNQFDLATNRSTLLLAYKIMDNWPNNLLEFSSKYNIRYSDFVHNLTAPPYFIFSAYRSL